MGDIYTFTSDGYIEIRNDYAYLGFVNIHSANNNHIGVLRPLSAFQGHTACATCFVKRGMWVEVGPKQFTSCTYSLLE